VKILLIQPPPRVIERETIIVPPLGLAYLAAVLHKDGHDVSILDAFAMQLDWPEFEKRVAEAKADLIGVTGMTPVVDNSLRALKIARPHCKYLVFGGAHVSAFKQKVFDQAPEIDFAMYGECENAFAELVKTLERGGDPAGLPGVITKNKTNAPPRFIENLDTLPFPARDLLPNERYRYALGKGGRVTTMFTSRGCPYGCVFCDKSTFTSKWRARSAESILAEVEEIVAKYRVRSIIIYDDLFTVDKKRVKEFCEGIIRRGLKIDWKCEGRVNIVDEEMLALMKRAGCSMIAYGVESANQHGLDYLNKGTTPDMARNAFAATRKAGIRTMGYFILGIPVETYEDAQRTINFAIEIKADYAQFSVLSPFPNTPMYDDAVAHGWYREVDAQNPLDKDLKRPAIISENWDEQKLRDILREAHRRFYLRPSRLLKEIFSIHSIPQLKSKLSAGLRLLRWSRKQI
jgi:radical SAM superfamily enzyme YgiQ (UPF0313 family)